MNCQSGKFSTRKRGQLVELALVHAPKRQIYEGLNLPRPQFSGFEIASMNTFKIPRAAKQKICLGHGQTRNWARAEFLTLKIETVENWLIRE